MMPFQADSEWAATRKVAFSVSGRLMSEFMLDSKQLFAILGIEKIVQFDWLNDGARRAEHKVCAWLFENHWTPESWIEARKQIGIVARKIERLAAQQ